MSQGHFGSPKHPLFQLGVRIWGDPRRWHVPLSYGGFSKIFWCFQGDSRKPPLSLTGLTYVLVCSGQTQSTPMIPKQSLITHLLLPKEMDAELQGHPLGSHVSRSPFEFGEVWARAANEWQKTPTVCYIPEGWGVAVTLINQNHSAVSVHKHNWNTWLWKEGNECNSWDKVLRFEGMHLVWWNFLKLGSLDPTLGFHDLPGLGWMTGIHRGESWCSPLTVNSFIKAC